MPRYAMCDQCGHRLKKIGPDEYICEYCRDDEDDGGESIDVYDAALIWMSNGMDEDYSFGYDEDELREALR